MGQVGGIQHSATLLDHGVRETIMNHGRGQQPQPGMTVLFVVPGKNSLEKERESCSDPNLSGNPGRYFKVRNWLSEYGLSSEMWGRLWVLVIPSNAAEPLKSTFT